MPSLMPRNASQIPQMLARRSPGRPPRCFPNASYFPNVSQISARCFSDAPQMHPRCVSDVSRVPPLRCFQLRCFSPDASSQMRPADVSSQVPFPRCFPDASQLPRMAPRCAQMPWDPRNGNVRPRICSLFAFPTQRKGLLGGSRFLPSPPPSQEAELFGRFSVFIT